MNHAVSIEKEQTLKIGISMSATESLGDFGVLANKIEDLEFESVWLPEHPVIPVEHSSKYVGTADGSIPSQMYHQVNPLIALSRASATTTHLGLGTAVNLVTEHNPIDLAKEIATLDFYSGGRFYLGVGTGWFREEAEIMGVDFDHRWTQAREHVLAMKEIWTNDQAEFHGQYVDFPLIFCNPKPVRKPHPPIYLGGNAKNVLRRVVRWGNGWIPVRVSPEEIVAARQQLRRLCQAEKRDPESIEITIHSQPPDLPTIEAFKKAGANRVLIALSSTKHLEALEELEQIACIIQG